MVDFRKRLGNANISKPTDPVKIYDTLDRASDKGELRRVQLEILSSWFNEHKEKRDVILKLHTGQGKTLIGLLILQSRLNDGKGPAVYLCPNNYLIDQTCTQAKQFGIRFCTIDGDLPVDFQDGKSILITSVQMLFNGRTKFGLGQRSLPTGTLLMDDCHACIDSIRDAFTIRFEDDEEPYKRLLSLFSPALEAQGLGSFAEIKNGNPDAVLAVPYWDWQDKQKEVIGILSAKADEESRKKPQDGKLPRRHGMWFVWPLLMDSLDQCACFVSGGCIEIAPRIPPLDVFGSFHRAGHRVFMSATVTDDSFLVKGLRLSADTIVNPLVSKNEKWSGEKMILIPSLINETLDRSVIVQHFARPQRGRNFGVVALVPSFPRSKDWEAYGSIVATTHTIYKEIEKLRSVNCDTTLVIANRYDGVDLPDDACRILVFDSRPFSDNLAERYDSRCRPNSVINNVRTARTIEQGLGRSVRGEKDYCALIITGTELIRIIRSQAFRGFFSKQTQTQIEIGLETAELAKAEMRKEETPLESLNNLIGQCLSRDEGWKAFYAERMDAISSNGSKNKSALEIYKAELDAEIAFQHGDSGKAVNIIQTVIDRFVTDEADVGWYLQEMARFTLPASRARSNELQVTAHKKNKYLLKPAAGMVVVQLPVSVARMVNIIKWVRSLGSFEQLHNAVQDIVLSLQFGVAADKFERAFDELGEALGFSTERPDKQWKEGPDNLWAIETGHYLLVECKSKVDVDRAEIAKDESGQMNNACAWFEKNYPGCAATRIIIIPTHRVGHGAGFLREVYVMRERELRLLTRRVKEFFAEFSALDWNSLSEGKVQELVELHHLSVKHLVQEYATKPR